ncbi:hypothetical protein [Novosphingobium sp. RL4]|uniref:hypothetical protein n=1 Tax=Novosphingobium sp. RL4 TaxID=3109595 RepID=UPI002D76801B|nr:hypothetical protein [Novosphingobium sp. RL4]WRT95221.1 hypothetical protein U9J33_23885 [Novosphingobium sp. RL4]
MHERLARVFAPLLLLEIRPAPIEVPLMREMVQYHAARLTDAGMLWLKNRLFAEVAENGRQEG